MTTCHIIGVDPGLQHTGWGVIEWRKPNNLRYLAQGVISPKTTDSLSKRLWTIQSQFTTVLNDFSPTIGVVEDIFFHRNPSIALKLGMAKGVILSALEANSMIIYEQTPNQIKKTVAGNGHADKAQVAYMVQLLLPDLKKISSTIPLSDHATDALAAAICQANQRFI